MDQKVVIPGLNESKIVLIVTHTPSEFPVKEIHTGLMEHGLGFETLQEDYNGKHPIDFYLRQLEEIGNASVLVAGNGVPIKELVRVAPNLELVVTTDSVYKGITSINGGPRVVAVRYMDNQYTEITRMVIDYLMNGSSADSQSHQ